jgi:hypothetical protein
MDDHTQHIQPDQTPDTADNLSVDQENSIHQHDRHGRQVQSHSDRRGCKPSLFVRVRPSRLWSIGRSTAAISWSPCPRWYPYADLSRQM